MARKRGTNTGIPGLSFSWKRALGLTSARQQFARKTGIPTTKSGMQRKIRGAFFKGTGCLLPALVVALVIALFAVVV